MSDGKSEKLGLPHYDAARAALHACHDRDWIMTLTLEELLVIVTTGHEVEKKWDEIRKRAEREIGKVIRQERRELREAIEGYVTDRAGEVLTREPQ